MERRARSAGFVIMEFLGSGEKIRRQERKSTKRWTLFQKRQQWRRRQLLVRLPEGCTVVDATALLSRAENGSDQDPTPGLVEYAQSCGVCFSTLAGEGGLLDCMVCQLPIREKAILFAHAVAASVSGSALEDPRKAPQYLKFCQFADQVAVDPALAKSVEGRDRYDFQKPNTRSKAYKAALACL